MFQFLSKCPQPSPSPQLTPTELSGLARQLNARAESVVLRDQPEQQSDMRTAARFLEEFVRLRAETRRIIYSTNDGGTRQLLTDLVEGAPINSKIYFN